MQIRPQIRPKQHDDLDRCLSLLEEVHRVDGYPRFWPAAPGAFLTPDSQTAAWVAELDGQLLGHIGLHEATQHPALSVAQRATSLPSERLVVVRRLMVSPAARRLGLGAALLATAVHHAAGGGQRVFLDVTQDAAAPVALYETAGWQRLEPLTLSVPGRSDLELWVYLAPGRSLEPGRAD